MAASEANYKLRKFTRVHFCDLIFCSVTLFQVPGPFPPLTVTLMDAKGRNMACIAYFEYGEDIAHKSQKDFFAKKNWQNGLQKSKKLVQLSLNILLPSFHVAAVCRYDTWRWSRRHLGTDS